jgi:hypothetical protein
MVYLPTYQFSHFGYILEVLGDDNDVILYGRLVYCKAIE